MTLFLELWSPFRRKGGWKATESLVGFRTLHNEVWDRPQTSCCAPGRVGLVWQSFHLCRLQIWKLYVCAFARGWHLWPKRQARVENMHELWMNAWRNWEKERCKVSQVFGCPKVLNACLVAGNKKAVGSLQAPVWGASNDLHHRNHKNILKLFANSKVRVWAPFFWSRNLFVIFCDDKTEGVEQLTFQALANVGPAQRQAVITDLSQVGDERFIHRKTSTTFSDGFHWVGWILFLVGFLVMFYWVQKACRSDFLGTMANILFFIKCNFSAFS